MKRAASLLLPQRVGAAGHLVLACLLVALAASAPLAWAQTAPADGPAASAIRQPGVPQEVQAALKAPVLRGQGRLRFLGLKVYEARLWQAAAGLGNDWSTTPLALEIRYQRDLQGEQIADRSLKEMRRQGDIDDGLAQRWLLSMKTLFPDVTDGTRITGLYTPGEGARFYVDGQAKGRVGDAEFARRFFGIWLAPQSSEPELRAALLGTGRP